jgi:DHA1 family bicyclomycin/chloramphenicol resistance-like MFS transporter
MKVSATRQSSRNHSLILVVALIAMIGPFSIDTYLPAFPSIEAEMGVTRAALSQTLSAYLAGFAAMTLFWGQVSDRFGRRRVMLGSILLYSAASLICAFANSFDSLMLARGLQGVAASGGFVASRATIRDAFGSLDAQKAMSQVMMLFSLAPAIAPIIGGWLHELSGWRSIFWFLTSYGLLAAWLVLLRVPETLPLAARQSLHPWYVFNIYRDILGRLRFLLLVMSLGIGFGGLFLYIAGAPTVIFGFLGLGSADFWVQFVPVTGGILTGSFLGSRMVHRLGAIRTVTVGFVVIALACVTNLLQVIWLDPTVITVVTPIVIYATGLTIAMPGITIAALDCFPENRGAASAMQSFFQMMINAGVAGLLTPALNGELLWFVAGQLGCFLAAWLCWHLAHHPAVIKI